MQTRLVHLDMDLPDDLETYKHNGEFLFTPDVMVDSAELASHIIDSLELSTGPGTLQDQLLPMLLVTRAEMVRLSTQHPKATASDILEEALDAIRAYTRVLLDLTVLEYRGQTPYKSLSLAKILTAQQFLSQDLALPIGTYKALHLAFVTKLTK